MSVRSLRAAVLVSSSVLALHGAGCGHPLTATQGAHIEAGPAVPDAKPPILLIHGMFNTPRAWDGWVARYRAAGYDVIAPAWPLHDRPPEEMRRAHPEKALGALTLDEVVAGYDALVRPMDKKPILIGHSMGGLVVQLLVDRGLGAAGVAIDSAPPKGVIALDWSLLKSNWPVISPCANKDEPFLPSVEQYRYAFANGLPDELVRSSYERDVVPESRRVGTGPTTDAGRIDFAKRRAPLLFIAGGADHIVPADLNWKNFRRYEGSPSPTEFRELPGRVHLTLAQPGWEDLADAVLDWSTRAAAAGN